MKLFAVAYILSVLLAWSPPLIAENDEARDLTGITEWHKNGYTGEGVNVLVLDLNGSILDEMESYTTVIDPEGEIVELPKHNTYVAQVIHEFAPGAHVYVAPWTHSSEAIIEWVKENPDLIDIVNVSLNAIPGDDFEVFKELGIPVFASAGNEGNENNLSYPASLDWTIAVGAYNWQSKGANTEGVTSYSNGGDILDTVAPTNIHVRNRFGELITYTGTSTSSPAQAGVVACYFQYIESQGLPKMEPEEVKEFIHAHSTDIEEPGFDYKSGHGLFTMPKL